MSAFKALTCLIFAAAVAGCTQPEPPPPAEISGQPLFDKYGDVVGCEDGVFIPGAALEEQCRPPQDECVEPMVSTAAPMPCPPPPQECDPRTSSLPCPEGRDDTPPDPRDPGTAPRG